MNPSEEPVASKHLRRRPDLVLIGCVKTKRAMRSAAKDLYDSPLWRCRRKYTESLGAPWFILSALHGLLDPDRCIDPYDLAMSDLRAGARRAWSVRVLDELMRRFPSMRGKLIEVHAGATYVDYGLEQGLRDAGATVHRPLVRVAGIGRQQAWYRRHTARLPAGSTADNSNSAGHSRTSHIAQLIASDFYESGLDFASRNMAPIRPWFDLPEIKAVHRLQASETDRIDAEGITAQSRDQNAKRLLPDCRPGRAIRLFLTFVAAMDRARDAAKLWDAGAKLFESHPELFEPRHVAGLELDVLGAALKHARVSQRHGPDSTAWQRIAKSLSAGIESPVVRVINTGSGDACELLGDLNSRNENRHYRFPFLRGPKLGPMWIRLMAEPGGARIERIEIIPVAVDVQVRRVTENLGVSATKGWSLRRAKPLIQQSWEPDANAATTAGPDSIKGTCAALDPALWYFGRHGCGHCEKARMQVKFGRACDFCIRFC